MGHPYPTSLIRANASKFARENLLSTETEIITQPFKKIPRLQQISPIEGCVIIYSHPLMFSTLPYPMSRLAFLNKLRIIANTLNSIPSQ